MGEQPVIAGCFETPYTRHAAPATTTLHLLGEAAEGALADANLSADAIDGLAVASFSLAPDHAIDLAWRLGLHLTWLMEDTNGGASGVNMVQHAVRAIEAGDATTILILAGDHLTREDFKDLVDNYNSATRDHLAPLDFGGPNSVFAMLTQRHAAAHGLERADYGALVVAQREHATRNPGAAYRTPLTIDEYLQAPIVADPLCIYDCVPVVTGADAVVVTAAKTGIAIKSIGLRFNKDDQNGDGLQTGLRDVATSLWNRANVGPQDIDVAMVYDDYPAMALIQLADLGFGEPRALAHQNVGPPVNTSGGQLSAGQAGAAGGLHGIVEAVRQLAGTAGQRQIQNATHAVIAGYGMVAYRYGAAAGAMVLERQ
jgi:acetyl-CoA acetyltransferase